MLYTLPTRAKTNERPFHKWAVQFPEGMQADEGFITKREARTMMRWLKVNRPGIYWSLQRGDFVENTAVSGYRSTGMFVVDIVHGERRLRNLAAEPDDYGTLPHEFADLPVGFQHNLVEDDACKSYWHNTLVPITRLDIGPAHIERLDGQEVLAADYRNGWTLMWRRGVVYNGYAIYTDWISPAEEDIQEDQMCIAQHPEFD